MTVLEMRRGGGSEGWVHLDGVAAVANPFALGCWLGKVSLLPYTVHGGADVVARHDDADVGGALQRHVPKPFDHRQMYPGSLRDAAGAAPQIPVMVEPYATDASLEAAIQMLWPSSQLPRRAEIEVLSPDSRDRRAGSASGAFRQPCDAREPRNSASTARYVQPCSGEPRPTWVPVPRAHPRVACGVPLCPYTACWCCPRSASRAEVLTMLLCFDFHPPPTPPLWTTPSLIMCPTHAS